MPNSEAFFVQLLLPFLRLHLSLARFFSNCTVYLPLDREIARGAPKAAAVTAHDNELRVVIE